MLIRVSTILAAIAVMGFIAGCSESPTVKYEASKTALENARLAEAELYAPDLFKEANDSLSAAMTEMQNQDSRFSMFRSYGKSEEIIGVAQQLAERASTQAALEKERIRLEDSVLIKEVDSLIIETMNLISKAPKGKGTSVDLKVMKADLDAASNVLKTAIDDYQAGTYLSVNEKLQTVKSQAIRVKGEIETAIAKLTKK